MTSAMNRLTKRRNIAAISVKYWDSLMQSIATWEKLPDDDTVCDVDIFD